MHKLDPSPHPDSTISPPTTTINPTPHISTQFYTFNSASHSLMLTCLLNNRLATPTEIRSVTSPDVLSSWRSVWKDRNEDTAYLTAWKRIQDKLSPVTLPNGNRFLSFKNNSSLFVSHVSQWHNIVMHYHSNNNNNNNNIDSIATWNFFDENEKEKEKEGQRHLGLKETIERIKQVWTVGAKFYGIPESYIRVCVAACPVCREGEGGGGGGRSKRRRFEYTESFDVAAREVPNRLQQLARKYKVVLCIRQKYIRYKPFMAEVKDYACHRAGEPGGGGGSGGSKKGRVLKREPYASKRCGCGFRIRAIVPIKDYNEKDKTFVYEEEGVAVFKLFAVHTGHEPGPLDGNARIMHRVVGHKGVFLTDGDENEYGVSEEMEGEGEGEGEGFGGLGRDDGEGDFRHSVLQQVSELRMEVGMLEGRVGKVPQELLELVSRELYDIVNKVRVLGDEASASLAGLVSDKQLSDPHDDDMLVGDGDLPHWNDSHDDQLYGNGKGSDLIEEDDDSFSRTLADVVPWDHMRPDCGTVKDLMSDSCKSVKWLNGSEFDEKSILVCENSKVTKPLRHDDSLDDDDEGLVGIQVDSFYQENPKWYDTPCVLDSGTDCGDNDFRHGEIV